MLHYITSALLRFHYQGSGFQRVRLKRNLQLKGLHSHVQRQFPRNLESTNLSRENILGRLGVLRFPLGTRHIAATAARKLFQTIVSTLVPEKLRHYTVLYYTILYYTILYYTILYCILCYSIIHYTILYTMN